MYNTSWGNRGNLAQHQIIDKIKNCKSADSVIEVLQEQARAFRSFLGDGKLVTWLKRTVNIFYALATSGVLGTVTMAPPLTLRDIDGNYYQYSSLV
jgi:hypothetical protein